ncbi:uncharacterized protein [Mytilus edulis]|uniref:uncharacterized protein n=1 Tax=Mytilus edulis TaxID=6550 RepID=UPI0039EF8EC3
MSDLLIGLIQKKNILLPFKMDMVQIYFLFELTVAYLLCMSYLTHGRMYNSGSSRYRSFAVRRKEEPNNAEKYISSLWKSALGRTVGDDSRKKKIQLTPSGGPGPTVIRILTNGESASNQPFTILSSGSDDDIFDFSTSSSKLIKIPDSALGPIQILKAPGKHASILVTTRRGKKTFANGRNQNISNNNQQNNNDNNNNTNNNQATDASRNYVGTFTGFLAESLCPLCRRLVNPRYRISCLLRYCYENPNISNGNPG